MKKITRRQFFRTGAAAGMLSAAVAGNAVSANACFEPTEETGCTQTAVIEGYDWGPGVKATILKLKHVVRPDSVSAEVFENVSETKESMDYSNFFGPHIAVTAPRPVVDAYTCNTKGERTTMPSNCIRLDMDCDPSNGSPFCYDFIVGMNTWCKPYELEIRLKEGSELATVLGQKIKAVNADPAIDHTKALIPQMSKFVTDGTYTGTDGKKLCYASYAPKGKNLPLVIWLHGAGEGGEDPSIALLGNKVTALVSDEFQNAMGGAAYVLAPQTPTFWLQYNEQGDWQNNPGTLSVYTQTLKELIDAFVAEHPDIDTNRIVIGGCSNGGYMTMNMVMQYPDYFAAAYPICEAYRDSGITDEQLASIQNVPLWFIYAKNDTTVLPQDFEEPTIARLKAIGANLHTSIFEDVHDTSGKYKGEDGAPYQYMGHWSWLYFFNNECTDDTTGENLWSWLGKQSK